MTVFHYGILRMQNIPNFVSTNGMDFIQVSIIHDNFGELNHRKGHCKSYQKISYDTNKHILYYVPKYSSASRSIVCCRTCDWVLNPQRPTWPTFHGCDGLKVLVDLSGWMYTKSCI